MASLRCAIIAVLAAACGDDGMMTPVDAPPTIPDGYDNGSCGDQLRFTGEYVDWDFHANACGIFDASFEVEGDGGMDSTAPNGRFDLCMPLAPATTRVTITNSMTPSMCSEPREVYPLPAIAVVRPAVLLGGGTFSARNFTATRRDAFFAAAGLAYDATKAQVHVHVAGTPRAVSLAASHGTAQALGGANWGPGDTGTDVFFPNVDVGGGTTMLEVAGGAIGTGDIPLAAGTMTTITVLAN